MLSNIIIDISDEFCHLQNSDGSFPAGNNGPHKDPETAVRNSAHWLITFAKCYELTGEEKYRDIVSATAEFLSSNKVRPYGFSFYHRDKKGKDRCNGLIGQAWTIEALVKAAEILDDDKYTLLAANVFNKHQFNYEYGLWHRLEIDGQVQSMDPTLNHQLWFAACGSLIGDNNLEVKSKIDRFTECLPQNTTILNDGLIHLPIEKLMENIFSNSLNDGFLNLVHKLSHPHYLKKLPLVLFGGDNRVKRQMSVSIGYHAFHMYAFAMLKTSLPSNCFWGSHDFIKTVDYMFNAGYIDALENNSYGYPYNPPGFEIPYALHILKPMDENALVNTASWWINKQFEKCYNNETKMMDRNTEDPLTLTARIYELTRLPNRLLNAIEIPITQHDH